MKVLVAGGAGYIGSTIASACIDVGIIPIVVDNFVTGRREFVEDRIFYEGDIANEELIDQIFREHPDIQVSVLCAALIVVPTSVTDPIMYYTANVSKSLTFVSGLVRNGCNRLIFSSSASIYRAGDTNEVDETSNVDPQSPYSRTKAVCEAMFEDIANASKLRVLSLRYFNPIGADPQLRTGLQLPHPSHALGQMILAYETNTPFQITGTDYPTRDGTGIRDYVHVWDLAGAHLSSINNFESVFERNGNFEAINLGTGRGTTVRELLSTFNRIVQTPITAIESPRRPGDVSSVFASNLKAQRLLGWKPTLSISDGVRDSLDWLNARRKILGF
jgi:UDP-glucose 4-epimerase